MPRSRISSSLIKFGLAVILCSPIGLLVRTYGPPWAVRSDRTPIPHLDSRLTAAGTGVGNAGKLANATLDSGSHSRDSSGQDASIPEPKTQVVGDAVAAGKGVLKQGLPVVRPTFYLVCSGQWTQAARRHPRIMLACRTTRVRHLNPLPFRDTSHSNVTVSSRAVTIRVWPTRKNP